MASGTLTIRGDVGAELGAEMSGGSIEVEGSVGDWAGAEMRGGLLRIHGDGRAVPRGGLSRGAGSGCARG